MSYLLDAIKRQIKENEQHINELEVKVKDDTGIGKSCYEMVIVTLQMQNMSLQAKVDSAERRTNAHKHFKNERRDLSGKH